MTAPLRHRLLLATLATTAAAAVAVVVGRWQATPAVAVQSFGEGDAAPTWRRQAALVEDAHCGVRPRSSCLVRIRMASLGSEAVVVRTKRRDRFAFLRGDDLPEPLDRAAVLLLGDSHVDGVVDTAANVGSLLERGLRDGHTPCYVLNAACGHYGLWQYVLRARELLTRFRAEVVVVVAFVGNDLIDLDSSVLPHLDDRLRERGGVGPRDFDRTLARLEELALPPRHAQLFWQGLNQAELLRREPSRLAQWSAKADRAIAAMADVAAFHGAEVLWVLLPSFDLVFPECVAALGDDAAALVRSGAQRRLADALADLLRRRGNEPVVLERAFRGDGRLDLYAADFHIDARGHAVLADAILGPLRARLERRGVTGQAGQRAVATPRTPR